MAIKQWDSMLGGQGYSAKLEQSYAPYPDSHHSRQPPAGPALNVGAWGDSFRSGGSTHTPKICLHSGKPNSHYASDCEAMGVAGHPESFPLVTCKGQQITFNSDGTTPCFRFNLNGSCSKTGPCHNAHCCTLCATTFHGEVQCTHS